MHTHRVQPIPCLRVTPIGYDSFKNRDVPVSKICHKASVAAEHYAITRVYRWWHLTRPKRQHADYIPYQQKLERRVLRVFKQYLP